MQIYRESALRWTSINNNPGNHSLRDSRLRLAGGDEEKDAERNGQAGRLDR